MSWFGEVDFVDQRRRHHPRADLSVHREQPRRVPVPVAGPLKIPCCTTAKPAVTATTRTAAPRTTRRRLTTPRGGRQAIRRLSRDRPQVLFTDAARIQLPWAGDPVLKATENYSSKGRKTTTTPPRRAPISAMAAKSPACRFSTVTWRPRDGQRARPVVLAAGCQGTAGPAGDRLYRREERRTLPAVLTAAEMGEIGSRKRLVIDLWLYMGRTKVKAGLIYNH